MSLPYGKSRKKYNVLRGLLLFFLLGLSIYILFNSSIFEVKEIKVNGNHELEKERIIDISEIQKGTNIFKINIKEATANLRTIPLLKRAEVDRQLPAAIRINIEERNAVALLASSDGFIEIDEESTYLRNTLTTKKALPVITGIDFEKKEPGAEVRGEGLKKILTVIKEMPEELILNLSEIHYRSNNSFILYTSEGIQCRMGTFEAINEKIEILQELLNKIKEERNIIEYVDLSSAGEPVIKYRE